MLRTILPRTLLALAILAGPVACDAPEGPSMAASPAATPAHAQWRVGESHRYAVDWKVDTDLEVAGILEGEHGEVRMHMVGEVILRVHPGPRGAVRLGLAWERIDEAELAMLGGEAWEDRDAIAASLLGHEVLCELAADGSIAAAYFEPDAPALFRHLMSGLLVHTDLRLPEANAEQWEALTPGSNGTIRARYQRDADEPGTVRRDVIDLAENRAVPPSQLDGTRTESEGVARTKLDAQGQLESIEAHESLRVLELESGGRRFASVSRFSMRRLDSRVDEGIPGEPADLDALVRQVPGEPVEDVEAARELAARFAGELTVPSMIAEMQLAGPGVPVRPGFIIETTGLLRAEPERALELLPLFLAPETSTATRERALDVLAAAGTAPAQAAMRTLLDSEVAQEDADVFGRMLERLCFVTDPEPETLAFAIARQRMHTNEGDSVLHRTMLHALGSLGRKAAQRDPVLAAPVHAILVDRVQGARSAEERLAALAGLGNFASLDDVERILAWQADPNPELRAQVATSLRMLDAPRARLALEVLVGDEDPNVAMRALGVLDSMSPTAEEAERVVERLEQGTIAPLGYATVINVLGRWQSHEPALEELARRGLLALAERTQDPEQREAARQLAGVVEDDQ